MTSKFKQIVRNTYLYVFSAVGLIIFLFGAIGLLNVGLKTYVFPLEHYSNDYWGCEDKIGMMTDIDKGTENYDDEVKYKECRETKDSDDKKRDLALSLAQLIIATPIWLYHWQIARRKEDY